MARRSLEITSFAHQNPIPAASRVGPLVASSIIAPVDPGTRNLPDTVEAQLDNLFHHVGEMLAAAGADWQHVAKMTFFVADLRYREAINKPWTEKFPDPDSRPARHTQKVEPAGKVLVTCDFLAFVES